MNANGRQQHASAWVEPQTKGDLYVASVERELVRRLTFEPELWHFAPSW